MDEKYNGKNEMVCYEDAHKSTIGSEVQSVSETQTKILNSTSTSINEAESNSSSSKCTKVECGESSDTNGKVQKMPIFKLWLVLILTLIYALISLVISHIIQSITLQVEAYHSLYNLMALTGCLITIKVCERPATINNTFGWARIELLSCLCSLLFVASFCFSISLESMQAIAYGGNQDAVRHPLPVIGLGGIGLILNFFVYYLIGGYTHHQGCFLEQRSSGVWVQSRVSGDAVHAGMRSSRSKSDSENGNSTRSYEGIRGLVRDTCGLVIAIVSALLVLWDTRRTVVLYIDPVFAMISAIILLYMSYPYGKGCCQILLQTIPGNIDVQSFSANLLQEFPEIVNVHHLHIWSLTPGKVIATAHVVYSNPRVYRRSVAALEKFFTDKEITQVTLQPEFVHYSSASPSEVGSNECLLRCSYDVCRQKECCDDDTEKEESEDIELHRITIVDEPRSSTECKSIDEKVSSRKISPETEEEKTSNGHNKGIFHRSSSLDFDSKFPLKEMSLRNARSQEHLKDQSEKITRSLSCNFNIYGDNSLSL